jgi:ABC-type dipeptide/oligopeptide/nickel transport system permease component
MIPYILKRLAFLPVLLLLLSALIFSMVMFLNPYQRLAVFVPNLESMSSSISLEELIQRYGLDEPFYIQYGHWLKELSHGNLGWSPSTRMPVSQAISLFLPATVELMLGGFLIVFFGGIALGTYTAVRHNSLADQATRVATIFALSLPEFIFGLLLLVLFYAVLGWFPPGRLSLWAEDVVYSASFRRFTGMNTMDALLNGNLPVFLDALRHLVLPAVAYSIGLLSTILRLMRSSLLETLGKEYVLTARAKGLEERVVVNKHARRNALLPIVTVAGGIVARMLGGAVIIETVFNYRGMGTFIVDAAQGLDFPAILGFSLVIGIVVILINLLIDVLYVVLDPTISFEGRNG